MRLVVEPVWGWPVVVVTSVLLLGLMLWSYPPRVRHLPLGWQRMLIALRFLAALVLVFAMLRPAIEYSETDEESAQITVLADGSRSMTTRDVPGGLTRRESLSRLLDENQELLKKLGERMEVRFLDFATDLAPVTGAVGDKADGQFTAIGKILDLLREEDSGRRLVSVFLLSDGAQRAGGDDDVDPRGAARRFAEQRGVPIHTVSFGTSEMTSSGLDLAIEDLSLDQPVTFERKTVPVRFQLRLLGTAGKQVRVRLLLEDRTGKTAGQSGELKEIPLSANAVPFRTIETRENSLVMPIELSFIAEYPGDFKIAAEAVPLDGEVKTNNNRLETLITVRKGGLRVAYFDVPRPEQGFIRRLNETAKIQLDMQRVLPGELSRRTLLSANLFEPGAYDVYLIGDVPAGVFRQQGKDWLVELAKRVQEGAGLAMLGGIHNFSAGGYGASALREVLPVKQADIAPADPESPEYHFLRPIQMLPTRDGDSHYLMRLDAAGNEKAWRALPALGGANRLEPKSAIVDVLAESAEGDPLMLAADTGRGRVVALGVDETWKWHLHGFGAEHQRFWQQLILWLARKEYDSEQAVWARVEPRQFPPLAKVPVEFGARDEQGTPITDAEYKVDVIRPDGTAGSLVVQRMDDHGYADFTDTMAPGDYWVRASAARAGQPIGMAPMTRFLVNARDIEMDNPAADPELMSEIAAVTGGLAVPPERFAELLQTLIEEGVTTELQRYRRTNLWDGWPLLSLFFLIMSLEWLLRKLRGLV